MKKLALFLLISTPGARQSELRPRRRADPQQGGLHPGHVPRRGQGQERLQALAARLRSGVRLPRADSTISPAAASTAPIRRRA